MPASSNSDHTASRSGSSVVLDIGGTWIKAAPADQSISASDVKLFSNPARQVGCTTQALVGAIVEAVQAISPSPASVVVATAGEIDASGRRFVCTALHLGPLADSGLVPAVEKALGCRISLINDAEAFALGLAQRGEIPLEGCVAAIAIGTGLGLAVIRDARWWKPARGLNLFGAIPTPAGTFDDVVSASRIGGQLLPLLSQPSEDRTSYLAAVAMALAGITILYRADFLLVGGGFADACHAADLAVNDLLIAALVPHLPPGFTPPSLKVVRDGNLATLQGAGAIAKTNAITEVARFRQSFDTLATEAGPADSELDPDWTAERILDHLWSLELQASERFRDSLPPLAALVRELVDRRSRGGRLICVGAGTSGRVASLDSVEMPCTFRTRSSEFVAVIAGGMSDSALSIEGSGEEDISSALDLILLQPSSNDLVIGISASGTSFFVRSALAYAKSCGAMTALLHESNPGPTAFADITVPLVSGPEAVTGSTRLKAGTATKRALNFLGTTAMVLEGKVRNGYMIDFDPSNTKLLRRAIRILNKLSGQSESACATALKLHQGHIPSALADLISAAE